MERIKTPDFKFKCLKCGREVEYTLKEHLSECDSPIGTVQTTCFDAFCKECGEGLRSKDLRDFNYILMVLAVMGFWRRNNPDGTKKQCHRQLSILKDTVDKFWELCLAELPTEEIDESEPDSKNTETKEQSTVKADE